MRGSDGRIAVAQAEGRARVTVTGGLDIASRGRFIASVSAVLGEGVRLEIDLRALDMIDSTGLASILEVRRTVEQHRGARLRIVLADDGPVRRAFEMALLHLNMDVRTG